MSPEEQCIVHDDFKVGGSSRFSVGLQVGVEHDVAAFRHSLLVSIENVEIKLFDIYYVPAHVWFRQWCI
jgi:hypothetical protein